MSDELMAKVAELEELLRDRDEDLEYEYNARVDAETKLDAAIDQRDDAAAQRDEAIADSAEQAKIIGRLGDEVDGLKAKLGRVKAWSESDEVQAIIGFCESVYMESVRICSGSPSKICWHWIRDAVGEAHVKTINDLDAILSDTTPPLAVVEGIKAIDGETSHRRACIDAWLPGKAEDWKDETYTLVVMPRESEGE